MQMVCFGRCRPLHWIVSLPEGAGRASWAVLMTLARPETGLFILGCLPTNRLVAVKAICFD